MKERFVKIKSDINKLVNKLETLDIVGPISYLEECLENIDAAIEEWDLYHAEDEDE